MNDARDLDWDARYRLTQGVIPEPCEVLLANRHLLPRSGRGLDLACGRGANALYLARHGLDVCAWDLSESAIAALSGSAIRECLPVRAEIRDVSQVDWDIEQFDVIVVARYLERSLATCLCSGLSQGGLLFYQTFTAAKISHAGPRNPDYLLADNELLELFRGLRVRSYREDALCGDLAAGLRDYAWFVGEKVS